MNRNEILNDFLIIQQLYTIVKVECIKVFNMILGMFILKVHSLYLFVLWNTQDIPLVFHIITARMAICERANKDFYIN